MLKFKRFVNGPIDENCFLVYDEETKDAVLIDPGFVEIEEIESYLQENGLKLEKIINTHGHWDHAYNNKEIATKFNIDVYISEKEKDFLFDDSLNLSNNYGFTLPKIDNCQTFKEGESIKVGGGELLVKETPGHTAGSVILLTEGLAFTGDTLFNGSTGRCDFPTGDVLDMKESIIKLKEVISDDMIILPGHGILEKTFALEKKVNPFLTGQMMPR